MNRPKSRPRPTRSRAVAERDRERNAGIQLRISFIVTDITIAQYSDFLSFSDMAQNAIDDEMKKLGADLSFNMGQSINALVEATTGSPAHPSPPSATETYGMEDGMEDGADTMTT